MQICNCSFVEAINNAISMGHREDCGSEPSYENFSVNSVGQIVVDVRSLRTVVVTGQLNKLCDLLVL